MQFSITRRTDRAVALLALAGCALHVYGQYPGPAESQGRGGPGTLSPATKDPAGGPLGGLSSYESSTQPQQDINSGYPSTGEPNLEAHDTVSVAELKHPLSRKGQALLTKAEKDLQAGRISEGLAGIGKAMSEPSAIPYAHALLGAEYLQLGRFEEAVPELEQAVQLLPIALNYTNLGYALCLTGDTDRGEEELRHALALDSSSPRTHYLMGLLLLDRKSRNQEACEQLQKAQSTMQTAHMALAVCYLRGGQDEAADKEVRQYVGSGDETRLAYWRGWASLVATQPQPSPFFGLRAKEERTGVATAFVE